MTLNLNNTVKILTPEMQGTFQNIMYNGSADDRQHTARILCKGVTHSGGNVIQELQCDGEAPVATVHIGFLPPGETGRGCRSL